MARKKISAEFVSTDQERLSVAGTSIAETGFFFPYYDATKGNIATTFTTTTSYVSAANTTRLMYQSDTIPGTESFFVIYRLNPAGDVANARLRNLTDDELLSGSDAALTGYGFDVTAVGPFEYTPTTTTAPVEIAPEIANDDGTTEVLISEAQLVVGIEL